MSPVTSAKPSFIRYWIPVLLYLGLIYFLSSRPFHFGLFNRAQKMNVDKIVHAVEYAFLGFLLARAMGKYEIFRRSVWFFVVVVFCLGVLYGMSDEFHQIYVPNRDANLNDVLADAVGVTIGVVIFYKKRFKRICPK